MSEMVGQGSKLMGDTSVEPHKPHEKWGDDKKAECAIALLACGSIEKAAKQCHISPKTLGHWSRHDDRFNEVLEGLQGEKALEHKHAYGAIVGKALKTAYPKSSVAQNTTSVSQGC